MFLAEVKLISPVAAIVVRPILFVSLLRFNAVSAFISIIPVNQSLS
jgi:hypothetical protein